MNDGCHFPCRIRSWSCVCRCVHAWKSVFAVANIGSCLSFSVTLPWLKRCNTANCGLLILEMILISWEFSPSISQTLSKVPKIKHMKKMYNFSPANVGCLSVCVCQPALMPAWHVMYSTSFHHLADQFTVIIILWIH